VGRGAVGGGGRGGRGAAAAVTAPSHPPFRLAPTRANVTTPAHRMHPVHSSPVLGVRREQQRRVAHFTFSWRCMVGAPPASAEQEQRQLASALASKRPVILFFKAASCRLCRALQEGGDLEAAAGRVPVAPITTDDQAAWAPEVRRAYGDARSAQGPAADPWLTVSGRRLRGAVRRPHPEPPHAGSRPLPACPLRPLRCSATAWRPSPASSPSTRLAARSQSPGAPAAPSTC
jgi:hypothetical protein